MPVKFWKTTLSLSIGIFLGVGLTQANVNLSGGKIILQGGSLKLGSGVAFNSYSSSSYVVTSGTGTVQQTVGSSAVVFPIGTSTSYSPITLTNSGTSDTFAMRVANLTSSVNDSNDMVNREWFLSEGIAGGSNLSATLQWNASDEGSSFSRMENLAIGFYSGSTFSGLTTSELVTGSDPFQLTLDELPASFSSIMLGNQIVSNLPLLSNDDNNTTAVSSVIALDGSLSLMVDTTNPALTTVTTSLHHLPPGTQPTIEDDGSISLDFQLGSNDLAASIDPNGQLAMVLKNPLGSILSEFDAPEGTQTIYSGNQLFAWVFPEDFTNSSLQEAEFTFYDNGSILVQVPILDQAGSPEATSKLHIPPGSLISAGYTAHLRSTLPSYTQSDGSQVTPSLTLNSMGEVEVTLARSLGGSESKLILPKLSAGSEFQLQDNPDGTKSILALMPLKWDVSAAARQSNGAVRTVVEQQTYYMGRDLQTNAAIYLASSTDNTSLQIERSLSDMTTTITVLSGTVVVINGGYLSTLQTADALQVNNASREFHISTSNLLFCLPINETISAADLEIRFPDVHSIWLWDEQHQLWQSYSPNLETAYRMVTEIGIPTLRETSLAGQGLYLSSTSDFTLTLPDAPSGSLPDTAANSSSEWRLLGNNTADPVMITELLMNLPKDVLALWRYFDGQWQVYSSNADILKLKEEEGVAEWPLSQALAVGEAYWAQIQPTARISRQLRQPPSL
jgi:hypothetical protein